MYDPHVQEKKKDQIVKLIHLYFEQEEYDIAQNMTERLLIDHSDDIELVTLLNNILLAKRQQALQKEQKYFGDLAKLLADNSLLMMNKNKDRLNELSDLFSHELKKMTELQKVTLDSHSEEIEKLINEGVDLYNQGNILAAKEKFSAVLKLDEANPYANAYYGAVLYEENPMDAKRLEMATKKCKKALDQVNTIEIAHFILGNVYEKKRLYDSAIKEYLETLKINPENYFAFFRTGMIYSRLSQYEKAIQYLKNSVKVNREFVDGYYYLADSEIQLANYSSALKYLDNLLDIDEDFHQAYIRKAEIYRLNRDYEQAAINYDKAVALNKHYETYYYLADCYQRLGQEIKAVLTYESSLKHNQLANEKDQLFLINSYQKLIGIKSESGKLLEALGYANSGKKKLGDKSIDILLLAADLNYSLKKYEPAANDYLKVLSLLNESEEHYQIYHKLGKSLFEQKKYAQAEQYLSKAIEINVTYFPAYEEFVKLQVEQKNIKAARKMISQFGDTNQPNNGEIDILMALVKKGKK